MSLVSLASDAAETVRIRSVGELGWSWGGEGSVSVTLALMAGAVVDVERSVSAESIGSLVEMDAELTAGCDM